jgi:AmpD protein
MSRRGGRKLRLHNQVWYEDLATRRCSPHFDERPNPQDVSLLVIHNISLPAGCFSEPYVDQLFMGALDSQCPVSLRELIGVRVSAHFFIQRCGAIVQYVAVDSRAWHAGVSHFDGREACNDFSIGIELEGTDTTPYMHEQYAALQYLTQRIMSDYPKITRNRIVGHSDIAPLRKTDPGSAFDWARYLDGLDLR